MSINRNWIITGAFGGKIAVATDTNPLKTRVNASISWSVGVPKWTVRVISVVPSAVHSWQI